MVKAGLRKARHNDGLGVKVIPDAELYNAQRPFWSPELEPTDQGQVVNQQELNTNVIDDGE
jgi:hypothetical protein